MELLHLLLVLAIAAASQPFVGQTQVPKATTVKTDKGDFLVPGRAFLDGRDQEAQPPLTVMQIRVWESPARTHSICTAEHGTQVELLEVQRSVEEERFYFRVRAPNCEGWLPDVFLSLKKQPPVGNRHR